MVNSHSTKTKVQVHARDFKRVLPIVCECNKGKGATLETLMGKTGLSEKQLRVRFAWLQKNYGVTVLKSNERFYISSWGTIDREFFVRDEQEYGYGNI